ncbi:MAG: NYN protein, partial [Candidatus Magasanikbacteria bacterium]|nr:NYN protein [Candidatus Magasanikbacteria bacterium]
SLAFLSFATSFFSGEQETFHHKLELGVLKDKGYVELIWPEINLGDGDFYCLALYLHEQNKLKNLIIPNRLKFSALLKWDVFHSYLRFMNDLENRLSYKKKKAP